MKVVILAGGYGTRISEESHLKPKPMIEVGEKPIIWHIMKHYSRYGFDDFVICVGYKGFIIKEYFEHYYLHASDVTFDFRDGTKLRVSHETQVEPWRVTLCDTGLNTMTGGRIKRIQKYVGEEPFMLTYGDGLSDLPLDKLLAFHKSHGKAVTVTAVQPRGRYGSMDVREDGSVAGFLEKPVGGDGFISAGFFVCQPTIFDAIEGDSVMWEQEPMRMLSAEGQVMAYEHMGFFGSMDSMRDKNYLDELWASGRAPWKG